MTSRGLTVLVAAHATSSALHFADNSLRFDHYHDSTTAWLNPTVVVVAWFAQTALGLAGLVLHRRAHGAGAPMLMGYGVLGFAGFLHYAALPAGGLHGWMPHALISLEAATGLALALVVLLCRRQAAAQAVSASPFAAFK